ncbi:hypothetical protein EDC04DRAFT_2687185 [Pisolithus marmoratus]|nr:hypothetical protein EDC04DRAFT_2687185 [Pisolithus marmoratus]
MYDLFRFEDIEFSPCFSSAVSLNVDESRVVSGFDEVPVLDFDDILRYPDDDDYNEGVGEKRESGIGLGLLFDGVSQTYACSCRGNAENVVVEGGVVRSRGRISSMNPYKPTLISPKSRYLGSHGVVSPAIRDRDSFRWVYASTPGRCSTPACEGDYEAEEEEERGGRP